MYIYKMPGKQRQELVEILNVGDRWYELGSKHMKYDMVILAKFAKEQYKPGGNPAEMLLSHWGSKNHTVLELFKKLREMEHYQAMDVIKALVPDKYHTLIDYNGEQSRKTRPVHQDIHPPIKYTQAAKANGPNIDITMEKAENLKKIPIENQGLKVEFWDATKHSRNESPRVRRQSSNSSGATHGSIHSSIGSAGSLMLATISYEELKKCCNDFKAENKLGSGGFGEVYYGILQCQKIAVKKIKPDTHLHLLKNDPNYNYKNWEKFIHQFSAELISMHTYPARNILRLMCVSFSEDLSTEPCLVYEFMSNGSVFDQLYKRGRGRRPRMTWEERLNIAVGTACGLVYLHKNNVVHGDIKSGNILLDENMVPKIGDFGLAKEGPNLDFFSYVSVSHLVGTPSYMPEDYRRSKHLTYAVDTYSFGMVLFELVTGKPPNWTSPDNEKLHSFIRENFSFNILILRLLTLAYITGEVTEIDEWVDKSIEYHPHTIPIQLFGFAKECTHPNFKKRTDIQLVFEALEKIQKGNEPEAMIRQKMYDDQKDKLEQQKAIRMMNQMKVIEGQADNKSTVPIGNNDVCGIPSGVKNCPRKNASWTCT